MMPTHGAMSKPGTVSLTVGTSGSTGTRFELADAERDQLALADVLQGGLHVVVGELHLAADDAHGGGPRAFVGHMQQLHPGLQENSSIARWLKLPMPADE